VQYSWLASGVLPLPWFHLVIPSVSCCTDKLDCSSYILRLWELQNNITILWWAALEEESEFNNI